MNINRPLFNYGYALTVSVFAAILLQCSPLDPMSPFNRVEESRIRPVGMTISPQAEGAPGDTLRVAAYFAGKSVVRVDDIRVCRGEFDTVGTPVEVVGLTPALPDSLGFSYILPAAMLDSVAGKALAAYRNAPELGLLVSALAAGSLPPISGFDSSQIAVALEFLSDLDLKCRFRLTAVTADGEALRIRKDFMVRYNCRFKGIPELSERLPVNRNPALRFVALYKVRGAVSEFDPNDSSYNYSVQYLQTSIPGTTANDTIEFDTGYSYFLGTDTGIVVSTNGDGKTVLDSCIDRYKTTRPASGSLGGVKDTFIREGYYYVWMYETQGGSSASYDDRMAMDDYTRNGVIHLYPPLDLGVTGCTLWVKISDYLESGAERPVGVSRACVHCVFRYTDAYKTANGG